MNALIKEKAELEAKEDVSERWMWFGMFLVFAGVLLETIPEFLGRGWFIDVAHRYGSATVAIGLAVEFAVELYVSKYRGRLRGINGSLIFETQKQAAEANLARVKIEEHLAWRTITDDQRESLVGRLSKFAGQQISLSAWPVTDEIARFRFLVAAALNEAGWKWTLESIISDTPGVLTRGFSVSSTPDQASSEAANELFEALTPMGRGGVAMLGALRDTDTPHVHLIIQDRSGPFPEGMLW